VAVDDTILLERNLRGLAALHRLVGRYAGTVLEFDGAVGSIVHAAPDYPWLNALVCERGANLREVLEHIVETTELDRMTVWACGLDQAKTAVDAGFTNLIARLPAMSMELGYDAARGDASESIGLAEAGALSDTAYGNHTCELERTLARIPAEHMRARGRRDADGRIVSAAVLLDLEDDCSIQYMATRPDAQRLGHGVALLGEALAQAHLRGCRTTSLQSSEAGVHLYRRLGYRTVGHLGLYRRPSCHGFT
jgi:ribosomal protein S18 acetylase RimI-like enzyme